MTTLAEARANNQVIGPLTNEYRLLNSFYTSGYDVAIKAYDRYFSMRTVQHIILMSCLDSDELIQRHTYYFGIDPLAAKNYMMTSLRGMQPNISRLYYYIAQYYYAWNSSTTLPNSINPATTLFTTGNKIIIHANWWHDNNLGVCMCRSNRYCDASAKNYYGIILMACREMIKNASFPQSVIDAQRYVAGTTVYCGGVERAVESFFPLRIAPANLGW